MVDHFRSMPSPKAFLILKNLKENRLAWTDNFDSVISDILAGLEGDGRGRSTPGFPLESACLSRSSQWNTDMT